MFYKSQHARATCPRERLRISAAKVQKIFYTTKRALIFCRYCRYCRYCLFCFFDVFVVTLLVFICLYWYLQSMLTE